MNDDANRFGVGLGCNGIIDVLIEPIYPNNPQNPVALLETFNQKRDVQVMATVLKSHEHTGLLPAGTRFVRSDFSTNTVPDWLQNDMQDVLVTRRQSNTAYANQ